MRRNWLGRSALVLLPAAAAGALTAVATQPSAAYQASPAYHVSSAFYAAPAAPVAARLTASTESIGNRILNEAETRTGDWYSYGSAGPSAFDCSGLVYWASHKLGVNMPRTTYGMLSTGVSSGLLYQVSTRSAATWRSTAPATWSSSPPGTTPRSARRIPERGWAGTPGTPTGTRPCTSASAKEGLTLHEGP